MSGAAWASGYGSFLFSRSFCTPIRVCSRDRLGHARPLLIFLPAFLGGFSVENILAGAGCALKSRLCVARRIGDRVAPQADSVFAGVDTDSLPVQSGLPPRLAAGVRPYYVPSPARRQAL
jgi:hypothetical protein